MSESPTEIYDSMDTTQDDVLVAAIFNKASKTAGTGTPMSVVGEFIRHTGNKRPSSRMCSISSKIHSHALPILLLLQLISI